ncbi:MAG TPA: deoxynucleoside kinase [Gammaproteobacteria bacterium]|nr:deoxynucleoside kinase [Gammaproteobacteria bacterium]
MTEFGGAITGLQGKVPEYIVVEGPMGVGKSSLARRLAEQFNADILFEQPEENPFLERFYRSREKYALPTQLHFLFHRCQQMKTLQQRDLFHSSVVGDFLLEKDRLFAQLNLDEDELHLYDQIYRHMSPELPRPDLVIYLQAPVSVLMQRIRRRGIDAEQDIDGGYLKSLCDIYSQFFHSYIRSPLLVVNAENINYVDSDDDYTMLLNHILSIKSGRHYFNPLSSQK